MPRVQEVSGLLVSKCWVPLFYDAITQTLLGLSPVAVTSPSDLAPGLSEEVLDIQATIECGFTLKCVCDMARTLSQMHRTDKYSQHSSN